MTTIIIVRMNYVATDDVLFHERSDALGWNFFSNSLVYHHITILSIPLAIPFCPWYTIIMKNPLREYRDLHGWSQDNLSELSGISKSAIQRAEQGCYGTPLPGLMAYFSRYPDFDSEIVLANYGEFVSWRRKTSYGRLTPKFWEDVPLVMFHPFKKWMEYSGITTLSRVATSYCIGQSTVSKFVNRPHLCRAIPGQVTLALSESGYSERILQLLNESYDRHFNYLVRNGLVPNALDGQLEMSVIPRPPVGILVEVDDD